MSHLGQQLLGVRSTLQLPVDLFDGYLCNQKAMIAASPGVRLNATINQGKRITSVAFIDNQMAIRGTTQSTLAVHLFGTYEHKAQ